MTARDLNLSGTWDGVFSYPDMPEAGPTTPFLADIRETNGAFTGTVIEPHELDRNTIRAIIHGQRTDHLVQFAKDYEEADEYYQATVQYSGSLSEDGNTITGEWSIDHWRGAFEMTRASGAQEEVQTLAEADVSVSAQN